MTIYSHHPGRSVSAFVAATAQLSHPTAFGRLAGVAALASVADQWPARRQQCVDLFCAYLRTPMSVPSDLEEVWVREAILETIASRLRRPTRPGWARRLPARAPWEGVSLNFSGCHLPRLDFSGCHFDGPVNFIGATFEVDALFNGATFNAPALFMQAMFENNNQFDEATFNAPARFTDARFCVSTSFTSATFNGPAQFIGARFHGWVWLDGVKFNAAGSFADAILTDAIIHGEVPATDAADTDASVDEDTERQRMAALDKVARGEKLSSSDVRVLTDDAFLLASQLVYVTPPEDMEERDRKLLRAFGVDPFDHSTWIVHREDCMGDGPSCCTLVPKRLPNQPV